MDHVDFRFSCASYNKHSSSDVRLNTGTKTDVRYRLGTKPTNCIHPLRGPKHGKSATALEIDLKSAHV